MTIINICMYHILIWLSGRLHGICMAFVWHFYDFTVMHIASGTFAMSSPAASLIITQNDTKTKACTKFALAGEWGHDTFLSRVISIINWLSCMTVTSPRSGIAVTVRSDGLGLRQLGLHDLGYNQKSYSRKLYSRKSSCTRKANSKNLFFPHSNRLQCKQILRRSRMMWLSIFVWFCMCVSMCVTLQYVSKQFWNSLNKLWKVWPRESAVQRLIHI